MAKSKTPEQFRQPLEQIEANHRLLQDRIEWPQPSSGNEDDDSLFDSQRDYLDQIARYKAHQGKSITERRPRCVQERLNARARRLRAAAKVVRP
jgi:hypothetical protein